MEQNRKATSEVALTESGDHASNSVGGELGELGSRLESMPAKPFRDRGLKVDGHASALDAACSRHDAPTSPAAGRWRLVVDCWAAGRQRLAAASTHERFQINGARGWTDGNDGTFTRHGRWSPG